MLKNETKRKKKSLKKRNLTRQRFQRAFPAFKPSNVFPAREKRVFFSPGCNELMKELKETR